MTSTAIPAEAFEEYMLADDRPQYPMSIHVRLHFVGRIDRTLWEQSWSAALARHPLLQSTLQAKKYGLGLFTKWIWERQESSLTPQTTWEEVSNTPHWPHTPKIDLDQQVGVRAWIQQTAGESWLTIHFHHAVVDGAGAMAAVRDWLQLYHAAAQQAGLPSVDLKPRPLPTCSEEKLRVRGTFGLRAWDWLKMVPAQVTGLIGALEFMSHKTGPLLPATASSIPPSLATDFPAVVTQEVSAETFSAFRAKAKADKATVNDLMLRDMFLAIAAWREAEGIATTAPYVRISVPMNLRHSNDADMPACNIVSMVFLDRRKEDLQDEGKLLSSICDQMTLIKNRKLGLTLILALRAIRWIRGGIAMMTAANDCRSTTVLSNVGEAVAKLDLPQVQGEVQSGNLLLKDLWVLAPIRPLTQGSFVVHSYAGRLGIALHFDSQQLTRSQAENLTQRFVEQMQKSC